MANVSLFYRKKLDSLKNHAIFSTLNQCLKIKN
jgi:hypothetical protein